MALLGGTLAVAELEPSAATETLVGRGSDAFAATEVYRERFGDHAIVILVKGARPDSLGDIVLTKNLGRLLGLEGCMAGNKPADREAPGGAGSPCDRLAKTKPVQVVYGPGTFINSAVKEIQDQLRTRVQRVQGDAGRAAEAARKLALAKGRTKAEAEKLAKTASDLKTAEFIRELLQYNVRYGLDIRATPYLNNPDFVAPLVFDSRRGATKPKAKFAYLFPSDRAAAIQVRLKPDLTEAERKAAIENVRAAVAMPLWKLENDVSFVVTGAPVVVEDLTDALSGSILRLLVIALVVMALVLAVVFRSRLRLLPLAVAMAASGVLFGLMALVRAPLTMASIAVLPVLIGLAVDYAIQYQARVEEEESRGDADTGGAALRAARLAAPTIATAGLATAVGFLVLVLSPIPMVRGFGVLLVVGIALALGFALSAGTAALVASRRAGARDGRLARSARGAAELFDGVADGVGRRLARQRRFFGRIRERVLAGGLARPRRVLAIGLALAAVGWAVDSQTEVQSDLRELVPQDLQALRDLRDLQETTGVSGEIDVIVEGEDLTRPEVVSWMRDFQKRLLDRFKYSSDRGCGQAELCPALSLPDLFRTDAAAASKENIEALLDAVPPYFSQAVMTTDRRTATLAFGIKLMPLDRQKEVIDGVRAELDPPEGVRAEVAGLPVLAADANATLASPWRRLGTLGAGLLAVFLVLLAVYRSRRLAWVPLVPIALATGWSALVLFAMRVPLNPMSATLGALVLAISTEFAVLLSARFRQEREAGYSEREALARTYRSTGAAVVASGTTAIAGFAVLMFSDVAMLRDFGVVTVVDLTVSLLGVLAVLPAVLVLADRRQGTTAA